MGRVGEVDSCAGATFPSSNSDDELHGLDVSLAATSLPLLPIGSSWVESSKSDSGGSNAAWRQKTSLNGNDGSGTRRRRGSSTS